MLDLSDASDATDTSDPSDASLCDISGFGEGEVSLDNSLPSFLGAYKVRESPVEPGRFDILSVQIYPEAPYNGPTTPGHLSLMVATTRIAVSASWSMRVATAISLTVRRLILRRVDLFSLSQCHLKASSLTSLSARPRLKR